MIDKNNIWFALVNVEVINGNNDLDDSEGAYVNIACIAENEKTFTSKVLEYFTKNDFQVLEIENIERFSIMNIRNRKTLEKLDLIQELETSSQEVVWGTFHTY
ncbi:hypothetical protein WAF17_17300 [Bernardetia sp. ABR2-2B]|uniref:hypothetical protein n=1 Tax=Bernardetia sp. ABR2-2B TaxID=3127472 RepID=UPI0030CD205D